LSGRVADRETLTPLLESQGRWLAVSLFRPLGGSARGRVEPGAVYLLQHEQTPVLSACCDSAQTRRASCCSLHALHHQFNRLPSVPSSAQFFLSGHIASLLHQTPPGPPPKASTKLHLHSCTNTQAFHITSPQAHCDPT